ncbi:biopolymer transport protein ExbD [Roseibium hamelinense]|uniref:Biopolymer transport protein ExbD n=1 Tax=Roseibium hamelinense TaxID=150831 RepID=A0A562T988_9HYPH|nr:biopolymer transporter ExbD [Roseibium hamelinense]MTI45530.1 biopolymer transporter ExbD [Roseibium hamelinense]TWI90095.1 biopolymer transport protein ExbD [Roseibium hamelinense]
MRVERPPKRRRAISLTPLVDVIFLLLLFFMLSSTFTNFGEIDIGAPAGSGGTGVSPKAILVVEGEALKLNGAPERTEKLAAGVQALRERQIDSLLVLVRGETTTQQLVTVLGILRTVPDLQVTIAR